MNNALLDRVKKLASEYAPDTITIRRHIHQHPELSNQEYQTADYISETLKTYGINHETGVFKTGIVGLIEGKHSGKTIALRADIDALPVKETNDIPFKSLNEGIMHACGHDVHTACLLGAARILNELKADFSGNVKLIFQPAEEKIPGGAKFMIEEGVLRNPEVDAVVGQHVYPSMEAGKVGLKKGQYMASADEINIHVKGKGGHAAMPDILVDTVLIASQIVVSLQQIASRNAPTTIPTVLSFGRFIAEGAYNVIPDDVHIKGTFRTFDEEWRAKAHERIVEVAKSVAESFGGECEVFIDKGYPFLVNDDELTDRCFSYAEEYLGKENVEVLDLRMTAEDFAYFGHEKPSCFYRLGTGSKEKGYTSNLHMSTFMVDEKSIEVGMGIMAWHCLRELTNE